MLKGKLIHPQILETLGRAGHSSQVLIADGNYPFASKLGPNARLVNLNLSPGVVTCPQVLEALVTAIPIEAACVMQYATTGPYALKADPPSGTSSARSCMTPGRTSNSSRSSGPSSTRRPGRRMWS